MERKCCPRGADCLDIVFKNTLKKEKGEKSGIISNGKTGVFRVILSYKTRNSEIIQLLKLWCKSERRELV